MTRLGFPRVSSVFGVAAAIGLAGACSSKGGAVLEPDASGGSTGSGGSGGQATGGTTGGRDPGTTPGTGGGGASSDDAGSTPAGTGGRIGALDAAPPNSLPPLPALQNVTAVQREDSVGIDFDPFDDAVDYRVYELPEGDVTAKSDGALVIKNAVYRCAGLRQTHHIPTNQNSKDDGNGVSATKDGVVFVSVYPYITAKVPDQPLLGYVYTSAAADRVAVYAVGTAQSAGEGGWRESRSKIYTTDAAERKTLLSKGGRDDGVVFYVPKASNADTASVYRSARADGSNEQFYFLEADRAAHEKDTTAPSVAFPILKKTAANAQPLYAVLYYPGRRHTELAVGKGRFERAANQGPGPLWHLEWSGITKPTTLVVEALAHGCPFQGFLSAEHLEAPPHQTFHTLEELRAASATGEVYINGQYDVVSGSNGKLLETPTASPVPIARAFLNVSPHPHDPAAWDWYQGFPAGQELPAETKTPLSDGASVHGTSSLFDYGAYATDNPTGPLVFTHGAMLGQFWHAFDDWKQDVTGRVRWTAQEQATVATDPSKFLHITWSVNTVSTGRRYPQLIVTDQPKPVDDAFKNPNGNFLIVQTIGGPSMRLDAEAFHGLINGGPWAVNNQPPAHGLIDYDHGEEASTMSAAEPPLEHAGMDRMTRYDAYISSDRLYVFMDGAPAACTKYPGGGFSLRGSVTVTFGDVLYHEGAETEVGSCTKGALTGLPFLNRHQCIETSRHWDDLGFKSGVPAPDWDEGRFQCTDY